MKMGRPKLPKGKAKSFQVSVRFTPYEMRRLNKAAKLVGKTVSGLIYRELRGHEVI